MINIQQIAQSLITQLESESVINKVRAEGVKLFHDEIMKAVQDAQKKEADEQGSKPSGPKVQPGGSSSDQPGQQAEAASPEAAK